MQDDLPDCADQARISKLALRPPRRCLSGRCHTGAATGSTDTHMCVLPVYTHPPLFKSLSSIDCTRGTEVGERLFS